MLGSMPHRDRFMLKQLNKYLSLILGTISIILIVIIFLNPPTDFDGGPMLGYNFLFFFPMMAAIGLLTVLVLAISIKNILKNKNRLINSISIIVATPGLLYCGLILFRFVLISTEPEPIERPDRIENNRTSVVLKGKTIHLTGFNFGKDYKRRRVYISGIPYFNTQFNIEDAYFCQGDSTFELLYTSSKDSIFVFIPDTEPMYHNINGENRHKVPVRAIQLTDSQLAELMNTKTDSIKRFNWEKLTEPNISYE
jgi:hypothetical protein